MDCAQNFTWHVEKVNMRKIGVCLRQCPSGYFTREFHHLPGRFRCVGKLQFFALNQTEAALPFTSRCHYALGVVVMYVVVHHAIYYWIYSGFAMDVMIY